MASIVDAPILAIVDICEVVSDSPARHLVEAAIPGCETRPLIEELIKSVVTEDTTAEGKRVRRGNPPHEIGVTLMVPAIDGTDREVGLIGGAVAELIFQVVLRFP